MYIEREEIPNVSQLVSVSKKGDYFLKIRNFQNNYFYDADWQIAVLDNSYVTCMVVRKHVLNQIP